MSDVASKIEFKRKQIASLAENGSDHAKAAIERLKADIAGLDPSSPEGAAAAAAKPVDPAAVSQSVVDALHARLVAAEETIVGLSARIDALGARVGVVEVLTAPQGA